MNGIHLVGSQEWDSFEHGCPTSVIPGTETVLLLGPGVFDTILLRDGEDGSVSWLTSRGRMTVRGGIFTTAFFASNTNIEIFTSKSNYVNNSIGGPSRGSGAFWMLGSYGSADNSFKLKSKKDCFSNNHQGVATIAAAGSLIVGNYVPGLRTKVDFSLSDPKITDNYVPGGFTAAGNNLLFVAAGLPVMTTG